MSNSVDGWQRSLSLRASKVLRLLGAAAAIALSTVLPARGDTIFAEDFESGLCGVWTAVVTPDLCNGLDDDCDSGIDEDTPGAGASCDTGLPGHCAPGTITCSGGNLICLWDAGPEGEVCNGLDDDCDGAIDEGVPGVGLPCDSSGVGACRPSVTECGGLDGIVCPVTIAPTLELCNGVDDDCNGAIDDAFPTLGQLCGTSTPDCACCVFVCGADGLSVECPCFGSCP